MPALRSLRAGFPGARVTLIGLPWAAEFAARFPHYVDAFVPFPGWPGLPEREPDMAALDRFLDHSRQMRFDVAIQLHGAGNITNSIVAGLSAAETWGFHPAQLPPPSRRFIAYPEEGDELRRLLRLITANGAPHAGDHLEFPVRPEEQREAGALLAKAGIGEQFVVVHAGGSTPSRRWPAEAFGAVAAHLHVLGLPVVLTGTAAESSIVSAVRAVAPQAISLAGRTSLGSLAALVARARLVVANDTSISHIAAATRTPSVVVFSGSEMERWAPLDRELHRTAAGTPGPWAGSHPGEVRHVVDEVERALEKEGARVLA